MIAETNPNHVAMMTGAYSGASGFPGNAFALYGRSPTRTPATRPGRATSSALPTQTSGESASCLQAQTVFEAVKRQGDPDDLTTAAILGKPKLGRIFSASRGGRDVDYLWAPCASRRRRRRVLRRRAANPVTGYAVDDGR